MGMRTWLEGVWSRVTGRPLTGGAARRQLRASMSKLPPDELDRLKGHLEYLRRSQNLANNNQADEGSEGRLRQSRKAKSR